MSSHKKHDDATEYVPEVPRPHAHEKAHTPAHAPEKVPESPKGAKFKIGAKVKFSAGPHKDKEGEVTEVVPLNHFDPQSPVMLSVKLADGSGTIGAVPEHFLG